MWHRGPNHRRPICCARCRTASRFRRSCSSWPYFRRPATPSLPVPSLVVATSAIRDEGTSYHYLPAADIVTAPAKLAANLYEGLQGLELPVTQGLVWTTDAPYRETAEELTEHAANGSLAVEMQAASLFAFAEARQANVGMVAHVTNAIDHTGEPFDKGSDEHGWHIVQAMCRACIQWLA